MNRVNKMRKPHNPSSSEAMGKITGRWQHILLADSVTMTDISIGLNTTDVIKSLNSITVNKNEYKSC